MTEITMPQLSESMLEGRLLRWCVSVGSAVKAGDVIAEVETDKANMEIEVLDDGVVTELRAMPGDYIPVGAVLASIETGAPEAQPASTGKYDDDEESEYVLVDDAQPAPEATVTPADSQKAAESATAPPPAVSPIAARLAAMYNVDLSTVKGTGPGGRIIKEDVLAHRSGYPRAEGEAAVPPEVGQRAYVPVIVDEAAESTDPEPEPVSSSTPAPDDMFGGIPKDPNTAPPVSALTNAAASAGEPLPSDQPACTDPSEQACRPALPGQWGHAPLTCASAEVSAEDVLRSLPALQSVLGGEWVDVDPGSFLVPVSIRAAALALKLAGRTEDDCNIALGVMTDTALLFPVLRGAAAMPLRPLVEECAMLPARTRRGELTAANLGDAHVAIVFLGRYGLDLLTGLSGPGGAPVLSLGALTERPLARGNQTLTVRTMTATLTFDPAHTPPPAAFAFMREFRRIIENPLLLALA